MKYKLSDICFYAKGKVDVSGLTDADYISTENMMPNKGGVTIASSLPSTAQTQAYRKDDVLVSNIRPYFKKIWFAVATAVAQTMYWSSEQKRIPMQDSFTMCLQMMPFLIIQQQHQKVQKCHVVTKQQ